MEIHWYGPALLSRRSQASIERCVRRLAQERNDLLDVRIAARTESHSASRAVRIRVACRLRRHHLIAERSACSPGSAAVAVVGALTREVRQHRRRLRSRRVANHPPQRKRSWR